MKQHPTAGARIRMTLEGIVRDAYQPGVFTLGDGTHVSYTPGQHAVTILAPGWEPGDKIETEYGTLIRVVDDEGYAHWRDFYDSSVTFHDDQLYMDDVRVLHRVTPQPEQAPAAAPVDPHNYVAKWQSEAAAKRRLPDCKTCNQPANDPAHDGDRSETTSLYRMLLNA